MFNHCLFNFKIEYAYKKSHILNNKTKIRYCIRQNQKWQSYALDSLEYNIKLLLYKSYIKKNFFQNSSIFIFVIFCTVLFLETLLYPIIVV